MRRFLVAALAVAALVPVGAHASTTAYGAPYAAGPRGGDQFNLVQADAATGRLAVLRVQPPIPTGGLGCGGKGGFATFEVRDIQQPITKVTLAVDEAAWNPFAWVTLSVIATDDGGVVHYLGTQKVRGPGAGPSTIELPITPEEQVPAGTTQSVRFGMEVASSCIPAVDGGSARFSVVTVETA